MCFRNIDVMAINQNFLLAEWRSQALHSSSTFFSPPRSWIFPVYCSSRCSSLIFQFYLCFHAMIYVYKSCWFHTGISRCDILPCSCLQTHNKTLTTLHLQCCNCLSSFDVFYLSLSNVLKKKNAVKISFLRHYSISSSSTIPFSPVCMQIFCQVCVALQTCLYLIFVQMF